MRKISTKVLFTLLLVFSQQNCFFAAEPLLAPLSSDDEFLSIEEYQEHLWRNPRGIGCNHCHGKNGEEVELVKYISNGRLKTVIIGSIKNISWEKFNAALSGKSGVKNIMPDYHLTQLEIKNLYSFITKEQK